jgi:hypothetical protein
MTKQIRIDAEAEDEIAHAMDGYARERNGLGAEFLAELSAAMNTLSAPGPECGPVIRLPRELGVRRKLLARFPYAIVFVESDTFVRVISVMHGIADRRTSGGACDLLPRGLAHESRSTRSYGNQPGHRRATCPCLGAALTRSSTQGASSDTHLDQLGCTTVPRICASTRQRSR